MRETLQGQRVVVMGVSSGIGRSLSEQAAAHGAHVVMVSRSRERLRSAAEHIDGDVEIQPADALDPRSVNTLFEHVGGFDHLAVTAVADETKLFAKIGTLTDELANRGMEKFWITLNAVRAASRAIRSGGSITLTSSTAITNPPRDGGAAVMNAASGAVAVMGRSLAAELAPVRVNVIAPGIVDSGVWDESQRESLLEYGRTLPVEHLGEPAEIAAAYLFMMTAAYITGVVLPVDGGLSLL